MQPLPRGQRLDLHGHRGEELVQIHGLGQHFFAPRLDPLEIEHGIDQPQQMPRIGVDTMQRLGL